MTLRHPGSPLLVEAGDEVEVAEEALAAEDLQEQVVVTRDEVEVDKAVEVKATEVLEDKLIHNVSCARKTTLSAPAPGGWTSTLTKGFFSISATATKFVHDV